MSTGKPKPGEPSGAPFNSPGTNTKPTVSSQAIVALRGELKQLTTDLEAISAGNAGSTFAKGDKKKLMTRIATLNSVLATLNTANGAAP
jgi:hypothetical protein